MKNDVITSSKIVIAISLQLVISFSLFQNQHNLMIIHRSCAGVFHMKSFYEKQGSQFAYTAVSTLQEPHPHSTAQPNTHLIPFVAQNMQGIISVHNPKLHLEVATLQSFLDDYMKGSKSAKIDYVHDKDVVAELGAKPNNIGFYLPAISKHDFFRTIIVEGALPSKTFSMGKADEKRFYLECRKITS